MTDSLLFSCTSTAVFTASALWFAKLVLRRGTAPAERVNCAAHLCMSVLMLLMLWSWPSLPMLPQLVVFTAATLWFAAQCVLAGSRSKRAEHLHHAVMMGAMLWMVAAMAVLPHSPAHAAAHHGSAAPTSTIPVSAAVLTAGLGLLLIASSLRWIASAVDTARSVPVIRVGSIAVPACHGAMALSMGMLLLTMLLP